MGKTFNKKVSGSKPGRMNNDSKNKYESSTKKQPPKGNNKNKRC